MSYSNRDMDVLACVLHALYDAGPAGIPPMAVAYLFMASGADIGVMGRAQGEGLLDTVDANGNPALPDEPHCEATVLTPYGRLVVEESRQQPDQN